MSAVVRCPIVIVLRSREQRLRDKRPASDLEGLLELQALNAAHKLPASWREIARSLGWSPGKLRRAIDRWKAATADPSDLPSYPRRPPTVDRA